MKDTNSYLSTVNIYDPYSERIPFLEELSSTGAFWNPLTIIGGDLNFSMSLQEVWGLNPRLDAQIIFFNAFIQANRLVYIDPHKLTPTWYNFRMREEAISR
jgi:hypothetical protein